MNKDTREKLEADIRRYVLHVGEATVMSERTDEQVVHGWLDRQAAITRRECLGIDELDQIEELKKDCAIWHDLAKRWETECDRQLERIDELHAKLDAIAETHMPLPLDADGVPIRIGDMLTENGDPCKFEVMSLTYYEDCVDVNACGANPKLCTHVKPRTIEDVLRDAGVSVAAIEDVAAEIRELMEVGE